MAHGPTAGAGTPPGMTRPRSPTSLALTGPRGASASEQGRRSRACCPDANAGSAAACSSWSFIRQRCEGQWSTSWDLRDLRASKLDRHLPSEPCVCVWGGAGSSSALLPPSPSTVMGSRASHATRRVGHILIDTAAAELCRGSRLDPLLRLRWRTRARRKSTASRRRLELREGRPSSSLPGGRASAAASSGMPGTVIMISDVAKCVATHLAPAATCRRGRLQR
jgi:hypothetical protein